MNTELIFEISQIIISALLISAAYLSIRFKDLLAAVISLAVFGLILSVEFFILHAPDVAIAEAAIGAGLVTAIFIFTIKSTKRMEEEIEG